MIAIMKTKKVKIKKDEWTLISKNRNSLQIDFPDFKKGDYKIKIGETEIDARNKTIKLNGKNKIEVYCKSKNDSVITIKRKGLL